MFDIKKIFTLLTHVHIFISPFMRRFDIGTSLTVIYDDLQYRHCTAIIIIQAISSDVIT